MPVPCPKTHYDVVRHFRPAFVDEIARKAESYEDRDTATVGETLDRRHLDSAMLVALSEFARFRLEALGYETRHMSAPELVATLPPEEGQGMMDTLHLEYIHLMSFEAFGRKTFHVRPNLAARLADTEMNVDSAFLRLPFPSCMFVFDCQIVRDAIYAVGGQPSRPTGPVSVYVNTYRSSGGGLRFEACGFHTSGKQVGILVKREIPLGDGIMLEDALRTDWVTSGLKNPMSDQEDDSIFYGPGLRFMRIVINTALYLSSANPDILPGLRHRDASKPLAPHEVRKREKQLRHATQLDYVVVGNAYGEYDSQGGEGRKLGHRVKVRGHWRRQAHGPGRTMRKDLFIEPFWKGPDMAEAVSKEYLVR